MSARFHDVLIIGSGAAGLTAALTLARTHKVLVLAKGPLTSGSTAWAQGGIAAGLDAGATFEDHIRAPKVPEENPNITLLPDRSCIDLITGRHEERYSGSGRVWGVYALDTATGKVEAHVARAP